jgi:TonB family protein
VSDDVAVKSLDHKVAPIYPNEARANRIQGTVVLHVVIGTDGSIKQTEPVSGDPVLAEAATVAVRQWKYKPTLLNAKSVEVDTIVKVDFHL